MPPRLARLLAVVAVVVLVLGAFVLRDRLAGDSGGAQGPRAHGDPTYRVLCDEDLGDTCGALEFVPGVSEVETMTAGEALTVLTSEKVTAGSAPFDAWLTIDPWPAMLDVARRQALLSPLAEGSTVAVASSTLGGLTVAGFPCRAPLSWDCLSARSATESIGIPSLDSAVGALALGHALVGLTGDESVGIEAIQDPALGGALAGLLASGSEEPEPMHDQVRRLLVQQGSFDTAIATSDLAGASAATREGLRKKLEARTLDPDSTLGVVLAPLGRRGPEATRRMAAGLRGQSVRDALARAGWNGGPAPTRGLPDPDVIYALREEYAR